MFLQVFTSLCFKQPISSWVTTDSATDQSHSVLGVGQAVMRLCFVSSRVVLFNFVLLFLLASHLLCSFGRFSNSGSIGFFFLNFNIISSFNSKFIVNFSFALQYQLVSSFQKGITKVPFSLNPKVISSHFPFSFAPGLLLRPNFRFLFAPGLLLRPNLRFLLPQGYYLFPLSVFFLSLLCPHRHHCERKENCTQLQQQKLIKAEFLAPPHTPSAHVDTTFTLKPCRVNILRNNISLEDLIIRFC